MKDRKIEVSAKALHHLLISELTALQLIDVVSEYQGDEGYLLDIPGIVRQLYKEAGRKPGGNRSAGLKKALDETIAQALDSIKALDAGEVPHLSGILTGEQLDETTDEDEACPEGMQDVISDIQRLIQTEAAKSGPDDPINNIIAGLAKLFDNNEGTPKVESPKEVAQKPASKANITPRELDALAGTKSAHEWARVTNDILAVRGGKFPSDWNEKVINSGIVASATSRWYKSLAPKD